MISIFDIFKLFSSVKVLKRGNAFRVVFFYPGEEGTYIDSPVVTLYENGIVDVKSGMEEMTTHLKNCEIQWKSSETAENNVRLLKRSDKE